MYHKFSLFILIALGIVLFVGGCGQKKAPEHSDRNDHSMHEAAGADSHEGMNMEGKELIPQKTCPVMGNAVNKTLYVDFQGKRIYVCCQACIDEVKKDPQKYIDKLESMGEKAEIPPSGD